MKYDKEAVYDEKISPLLAQILTVCKEEGIPMAAQFYLKEEREEGDEDLMFCTSFILPPKKEMTPEAHDWLDNVRTAMRYGPNGKPVIMTSIIRTAPSE